MEKTNEFESAQSSLLPFDPIVVIRDVAKRWLLIVLAALIVGVGTYILVDRSYTPIYRSSTVFVVTARGSSTTVYNNLSSTTSVAELFTELLNSSLMRKNVMAQMGVKSLDAQISTSVIPNTNLITMTVTSSSPGTAFLASQALINCHESLTYTVVDGIIMEVLQYPSVPMSPSNGSDPVGRMRKMAVLAAVAAAAALAALSFLRDAVRSGTEVRKKLDCEYLGEIPHERKHKTLSSHFSRRKRSILIDDPLTSFRYLEAIRKLRRRVEQRMGSGKVIMVTSLLENEGKSTVAVNLALSLAAKHRRALLIDCDLRKPACHAILEKKEFSAGIRELLRGEAGVEESVLPYGSTRLYMLLAKRGERNVGDMISSEQMGILLDWARENFDYVVLDLPPMAVASDAEGITALADGCVMVVRQNEAVAPALNKAIAALDGNRAKLLGCVLNNVHSSSMGSGSGAYGYGGYYKYGKYGHYGYGSYGSRK